MTSLGRLVASCSLALAWFGSPGGGRREQRELASKDWAMSSRGLADTSSGAVEVERRQDQPEPCNTAAPTNRHGVIFGPERNQ